MSTTDLEPLVSEILTNARSRGKAFTRADAVRHIHAHQTNLRLEGRIPEKSQIQDTDQGLVAVDS
jgi:hypothetical protein